MSKGPGKLQRAILELFENPPESMPAMPDSIDIASRVHGQNPVDESKVVSTRRALRGLAERGLLVDMGRGWRFGRRHWATPKQAERDRARFRKAFGREF